MTGFYKLKMSKIRIRNFGPIKDGFKENSGWMDVNKLTVFIGGQGSGKSTVAKLISTFTWMEKALVRVLRTHLKKIFKRAFEKTLYKTRQRASLMGLRKPFKGLL